MLEKLPIKIAITVFIVVCLWWLWPSSPTADDNAANSESHNRQSIDGSQQLVSSIRPITEARAAISEGAASEPESSVPRSAASEAQLAQRFAQITQNIERGQSELAIADLNVLIDDYPQVIEPYINLASLYADSGQLALSRTTLERAIKANPNTAVLFQSVQKVYGAQAAKAYRQALSEQVAETESLASSALSLPLIKSLDTSEARGGVIDLLRSDVMEKQAVNAKLRSDYQTLEATFAEQESSRVAEEASRQAMKSGLLESQIQDYSATVARLTERAEKAESGLLAQQQAHYAELASLRNELNLQLAQNQQAQSREQALLAQSKQFETVTAQQGREHIAKLAADQLALEKTQALNEAARIEQQRQQQAAALLTQQSNTAAELELVAANLVKSWAKNWSEQNVAGYVSHYQDNYVPPGSDISHPQWLEQRRVRLTNKKFINVAVSEFSVRDLGDQFSVTFTQHYRSNTVDDRIRKRLIFAKQGSNLESAKIVGERVMST